jgi:hypothetical protein
MFKRIDNVTGEYHEPSARKIIYGVALWLLSPVLYAVAWFQFLQERKNK